MQASKDKTLQQLQILFKQLTCGPFCVTDRLCPGVCPAHQKLHIALVLHFALGDDAQVNI